MGYDAVRGEELEQVEQRVTKLQYGLLIVNALTLVIALANFRYCKTGILKHKTFTEIDRTGSEYNGY